MLISGTWAVEDGSCGFLCALALFKGLLGNELYDKRWAYLRCHCKSWREVWIKVERKMEGRQNYELFGEKKKTN